MDKEIRLGRFDKWGYKNSFSKGELARELTYMNRDYDKLEQQVKKQKEVIDKLEFIRNRKNQGCSQETINKMAIELVDSWLKEVSE